MSARTTKTNYIKDAMRTECAYDEPVMRVVRDPQLLRLLHALIGLSTEANEMLNNLKGHLYYGKPLDKVNLVEEAGDCQWFLAILADYLGYKSFHPILSKNIAKLKERYPKKFNETDAINRDLDAERKVLEGGK